MIYLLLDRLVGGSASGALSDDDYCTDSGLGLMMFAESA